MDTRVRCVAQKIHNRRETRSDKFIMTKTTLPFHNTTTKERIMRTFFPRQRTNKTYLNISAQYLRAEVQGAKIGLKINIKKTKSLRLGISEDEQVT